jgi:hypothetical protein
MHEDFGFCLEYEEPDLYLKQGKNVYEYEI